MRKVLWSFLLISAVTVRCQQRITIFTSSGENEIDYEKSSEKSQTAGADIRKHSSKPLSIELTKSTKPSQDRVIEHAIKKDEITYDKDEDDIKGKLSDKRSSSVDEKEAIENVDNKYKERDTELTSEKNDRQHEPGKLNANFDFDHNRSHDNTNKDVEKTSKSPGMVCPEKELPRPLFAPSCSTSSDCFDYGTDMLCCDKQCVRGVKPPRIKTQHEPIFFGMIHRKCPSDPLPELSEVKQCKTDSDCFPRICCTEALQNGDTASYCRTPEPLWDNLPIPNQVLDPLKTLVAYMQCTPPPPPMFDLFPKPCQNPLDCFPNLCCQERGKRYCRPPKKSILALVAELGTRLIPEDTAKKFIERISR